MSLPTTYSPGDAIETASQVNTRNTTINDNESSIANFESDDYDSSAKHYHSVLKNVLTAAESISIREILSIHPVSASYGSNVNVNKNESYMGTSRTTFNTKFVFGHHNGALVSSAQAFNMSGLPSGAKIKTATLNFYVSGPNNYADGQIKKITAAWSEGSGSKPATSSNIAGTIATVTSTGWKTASLDFSADGGMDENGFIVEGKTYESGSSQFVEVHDRGDTYPCYLSSVTYESADGKLRKAEADIAASYSIVVGVADEAMTTDASGRFVTHGVVGGFSGLTIGADYYLSDTPGAISTTPGTNTIRLGTAISETEIFFDGFPYLLT